MNNDVILWLCLIAGWMFHTLAKGNSLLQDARAANINFNFWKDYIVKDVGSIFLALNAGWIWYFIYGEWVSKYPSLQPFVRTSFVVFGAIGSYVVQLALSRTKRAIRKGVGEKTDTAANTKTDL